MGLDNVFVAIKNDKISDLYGIFIQIHYHNSPINEYYIPIGAKCVCGGLTDHFICTIKLILRLNVSQLTLMYAFTCQMFIDLQYSNKD